MVKSAAIVGNCKAEKVTKESEYPIASEPAGAIPHVEARRPWDPSATRCSLSTGCRIQPPLLPWSNSRKLQAQPCRQERMQSEFWPRTWEASQTSFAPFHHRPVEIGALFTTAVP